MEIMLEIGIAVSTLSSFYESIGTGERYRETHFKLRHKKKIAITRNKDHYDR
jgi:hypothetical protein